MIYYKVIYMTSDCVIHSAPSLCALLSIILNILQFLQRHGCCFISKRSSRKSLLISWIWLINLVIYIILLSGLSWIIYREKLCRPVVLFILLLSLNWILNLCSLSQNQISKNQIAITFQVLASVLELISITWLVVVSLTIETIPWYYWLISIGSVVWGYLCNLLWLNSLYVLRQSQLPYESLLHDDDHVSSQDGEEMISSQEANIIQSMFYFWFTPVLNAGSGNAIEWDDLAELPESMTSNITRSYVAQPREVRARRFRHHILSLISFFHVSPVVIQRRAIVMKTEMIHCYHLFGMLPH